MYAELFPNCMGNNVNNSMVVLVNRMLAASDRFTIKLVILKGGCRNYGCCLQVSTPTMIARIA